MVIPGHFDICIYFSLCILTNFYIYKIKLFTCMNWNFIVSNNVVFDRAECYLELKK